MSKLNLPTGPQVQSRLSPTTDQVVVFHSMRVGKDTIRGYLAFWVDDQGDLLPSCVTGYFTSASDRHPSIDEVVDEINELYPTVTISYHASCGRE